MIEVTSIQQDYKHQDTTYSSLLFSVHVKRRSAFYVANVILPGIAINYLSMFNFAIPPESGEKIGYGVTIFLAQTVNMMLISNFMPQGASSIPLLGQYLLFSLSFIALSLLLTIYMVSLYIDPMPEKCKGRQLLRFALMKVRPILGPKFPSSKPIKYVHGTLSIASALPFIGADKREVSAAQNGGKDNDTEVIRPARKNSEKTSVGDLTEREQMVVGCETLNRMCFIVSFLLMTIVTSGYMIVLMNYSHSKLNA